MLLINREFEVFLFNSKLNDCTEWNKNAGAINQ